MYVRELAVHYRRRRLSGCRPSPDRYDSPSAAAEALQQILEHEAVEVCGMLCLTSRRGLVGYHELSRGTLDATAVHPREVFKVALLANARALIVGHNHPSGDPTPTAEDLAVTRRLVSVGSLLGVDVLDHIIIGHDRYLSLRHAGYI